VIYDVKPNQQHLRYCRKRARPIRTPEGYKFIALKSDTGTGKNRQLDVLLRALLYGQFNKYHTVGARTELQKLPARLGEDPGCLLYGARRTYDIEMTRKLAVHGAAMDKQMKDVEEAPVEVWQFHSGWKYNVSKRTPKIVVLDEAKLLQLCYTDRLNLSYQPNNQDMLEFHVQDADLVIVMDATLSQDAIDVISRMDPNGRWFVQENKYQSNKGSIIHSHTTIDSITDRCAKDIISGLVVAIASGSKGKLIKFREQVLERLPKALQVKYRTFVATTPGKEQAFEEGLDKNLGTEFSMLLYNGAMGVGVEYTLDHVDKRYMLVNYNEIPAHGYLQLLGRVRNPKDTTVELFIGKPENSRDKWLPITRDGVLQEIHEERTAHEYIKKYFKPCRDPSTRLAQFVPKKPWVLEALISNKIQKKQNEK
jgi:hypothetical protein